MPEAEGGISLPTESQLQSLSKDERLTQAAEAAEAAANASGLVASLRQKAAAITDPKQRERLLTEAIQNETQARGLSKKARILQSGTFQGAVGGAGIGAATAAGLGTVVGTLVGTVASIPTTAIGGLAGAGTGLIHGPWIKLGLPGGKEEEVQIPQESIDSGAVEIDEKTGTVTASDPKALREAAEAAREAAAKEGGSQKKDGEGKTANQQGERKKPKKLEVRSKPQQQQQKQVGKVIQGPSKGSQPPAKRKPPKLGPKATPSQKAAA